jgi:hypothetical protein
MHHAEVQTCSQVQAVAMALVAAAQPSTRNRRVRARPSSLPARQPTAVHQQSALSVRDEAHLIPTLQGECFPRRCAAERERYEEHERVC